MDNSFKKYLSLAIIATLIVFSLSMLWFVSAYSKNVQPASFRSFVVSGQGSVNTIPDIAQFSFEVLTQGGIELSEIQEQNAQKMNGAIAFLKEQGIEEKDITTKTYSVQPRYQKCFRSAENRVCPPPEIVGYTVRQQVQVKVRDFSILGGLFSGVVEQGANTVSQLSFTIDDPTQIQNEAREKAVEKAKEKAQALAKAAGFKVGRLLSIQEGTLKSSRYDFVRLEAVGAAPAPNIEPGSQDVEITVTLTYEIK